MYEYDTIAKVEIQKRNRRNGIMLCGKCEYKVKDSRLGTCCSEGHDAQGVRFSGSCRYFKDKMSEEE